MTSIHTLIKQVASTGVAATTSYILGENAAFSGTGSATSATFIADQQPPSPMPMPHSASSWDGFCATPSSSYSPPPPAHLRRSRAELSILIKKRPNSVPKKSKQKTGTDLAGGTPFSNNFLSLLGRGNSANIQKLDNEMIRRCIFAGLVEYEASRQCRDGRSINLQNLLNVHENGFNLEVKETGGVFIWRVNWGEKSGQGFISLVKVIFNLSEWDAVTTLADILGMNIDKTFQVVDATAAADAGWSCDIDNQIPQSFQVPGMQLGESIAELKRWIPLLGHAGQLIGGIAIYDLDGMTFCLPVAVGSRVLCIGRYSPTACLLNQDKIDANPLATVFLCQDIRTAVALNDFFSSSTGRSEAAIIVTGHIGIDLEVIPWNYLYGRNVVLLCAPNKESLALVKSYIVKVAGAGAASCKIYPYPLLHEKPGRPLDGRSMGLFDACEAELLKKARELDTEERSSVLSGHIKARSMTMKQYMSWAGELRLFPVENPPLGNMASPIFKIRENMCSLPQTINEVTLSDIFSPGTVTALHAPKNAGKSLVVLAFVKAISSGQSMFGVGESAPRKCLLFDSETPPAVYLKRCNNAELPPEGNDMFIPVVRLNLDSRHPWALFDVMDKNYREQLADYALKSHVKCLFLDNLTSSSSPGTLYTQAGIGSLMEWAQELANHGIAVIIVHHTLAASLKKNMANSKMRGSDEMSIRSHTEIVLVGSEQISAKGWGTKEIQEYARRPGATVGMRFRYCKNAPFLEPQVNWFYLPKDGCEWQPLGSTDLDGISLNSEESEIIRKNDDQGALEIVTRSPRLTQSMPSLSDLNLNATSYNSGLPDNECPTVVPAPSCELSVEAQQILSSAKKQLIDKKSFERGEVERWLQCRKTKAQVILSELLQCGILEKLGKGPNTSYRIRQQSPR